MKYAILSDIHGNKEALTAVIEKAKELDAEEWLCLGDIVGYGADPGDCIEIVKSLNCKAMVVGNHDYYVGHDILPDWFTRTATTAVKWTMEKLSGQDKKWLQSLPYEADVEDFLLVHSSPVNPAAFDYVLTSFAARAAIEELIRRKRNLCFIGHSHSPLLIGMKSKDASVEIGAFLGKVRTKSFQRLILNIGSVGQPRDSDCRAAFCIYDSDSGEATLYRVEYDIESAGRKIMRAGLPAKLANRLETGH